MSLKDTMKLTVRWTDSGCLVTGCEVEIDGIAYCHAVLLSKEQSQRKTEAQALAETRAIHEHWANDLPGEVAPA